jgi:flavin reductase (DIM6/NTAB) family NADH-FMN oxidoreductase RutF
MSAIKFTAQDIHLMGQRYRANFINSLGGFKSVVLVGTRNIQAHTNLTVFNSFFHIGAAPPLCGLIFRPDIVPRHTLDNILATGQYTINHINERIIAQAHQTSARYDRSVSEFDATGLTQEFREGNSAPYVAESTVSFGVSFAQRIDLVINGTILVIGSIDIAYVPKECVQADGFIDLEAAGTVAGSGLDSF